MNKTEELYKKTKRFGNKKKKTARYLMKYLADILLIIYCLSPNSLQCRHGEEPVVDA